MELKKIECKDCGGTLVKKDRFYVCEYCERQWVIDKDYYGSSIQYRPIIKKEIEFGQIAERSAQINDNKKIVAKQIRPPKTIEADVYRESNNLEQHETIQLIITFLETGEWDAAQTQVTKLKALNNLSAEAAWYGMACERRAHNSVKLVKSFTTFYDADAIKVDTSIQNATPDFAKNILDIIFQSGYVGDESTAKLLSVALPYIFDENLYSPEECKEKIEFAFDKVINLKYSSTFDYLLTHTLQSDEVDRYIEYLERFAEKCDYEESQKYYSMIIAVDPSNMSAHYNLINADIKSNFPAKKCIADLEKMLLYSQEPEEDVKEFISILVSENVTTPDKSEFMWALLGYLPEESPVLKQTLNSYAQLLLKSEIWKEASEFYSTILSQDVRDARAYFGLCLADMKAKNKDELIKSAENIVDNTYYQKALAISKVSNDEEYSDFLVNLTKSQNKYRINKVNNRKARIRSIFTTAITLIIIAVVLGLIIGFVKHNHNKKYSEDNIKLTAKSKETIDYYSCHFMLGVNVENGSSLPIHRIDGKMRFYNKDGKLLYDADVWLEGNLEPGQNYNYELEIDEEITPEKEELNNTPLSQLKITWELTKVTFKNGKEKEYSSEKQHLIHEITSSSDENSSQESSQDDYYSDYDDYYDDDYYDDDYYDDDDEYQDDPVQDDSDESSDDSADSAIIEAAEAEAEALASTGDYAGACAALDQVDYDKNSKTYKAYSYASKGNFDLAVDNGLKVAILPEGTEKIPDKYFKNSQSLEKVVIPSSVKTIGEAAFQDCPNLTEVTIANGVEVIGPYAFSYCDSLTNVILPDSLKEIKYNAFYDSDALVEITIPVNVTRLENYVFTECGSLQNVYFVNTQGWVDSSARVIDVSDASKNAQILLRGDWTWVIKEE